MSSSVDGTGVARRWEHGLNRHAIHGRGGRPARALRYRMWLSRKLDFTDESLFTGTDESRVREPAQSAHGHDQEWRVLAQSGDGESRPVSELA